MTKTYVVEWINLKEVSKLPKNLSVFDTRLKTIIHSAEFKTKTEFLHFIENNIDDIEVKFIFVTNKN